MKYRFVVTEVPVEMGKLSLVYYIVGRRSSMTLAEDGPRMVRMSHDASKLRFHFETDEYRVRCISAIAFVKEIEQPKSLKIRCCYRGEQIISPCSWAPGTQCAAVLD